MKIIRALLAIVALTACSGAAHAYRINVLDPTYNTTVINSPSDQIAVAFAICDAAQLPVNSTVDPSTVGCFSAINNTRQTLTTLEVTFPTTGPFASSAPDCSTNPALGGAPLFATYNCTASGGNVILFFSNGGIAVRQTFVITISDLPPSQIAQLPTGNGSFPPVITIPGVTPEPSSMVLLSTGMLIGGICILRRRNQLTLAETTSRTSR